MIAEPARSIEKLGFRRWYERQMFESHAWLVTCILCAFAACAVLEVMGLDLRSPFGLLTLALVYGAGLLACYALKRYRLIMREAERLGEQSTCSACQAYAAFDITAERPLSARCRSCGHEWRFR